MAAVPVALQKKFTGKAFNKNKIFLHFYFVFVVFLFVHPHQTATNATIHVRAMGTSGVVLNRGASHHNSIVYQYRACTQQRPLCNNNNTTIGDGRVVSWHGFPTLRGWPGSRVRSLGQVLGVSSACISHTTPPLRPQRVLRPRTPIIFSCPALEEKPVC